MPEGAYSFGAGAHFNDVIRRERDPAPQAGDGIADADGIVQGAEWISQDLEAGVGEAGADFIGEAAAEHGDAVAVGDGYRSRFQGDGSLEVHHKTKIVIFRVACKTPSFGAP